VHSESLRETAALVLDWDCNVRPRERKQAPERALAEHAARLTDGAIVHVKTDRLPAFAAHVLPSLRARIVLVTGDSDCSAPGAQRALLDDPRIHHWFAQNCDLADRHDKLTRIPIGLDNPIYTKADKRLGFLVTMALGRTPLDLTLRKNDLGQQGVLAAVAAELPPTHARPLRALCTFHQSGKIVRADVSRISEREAALRTLQSRDVCSVLPRRLPQLECWRLHGELAFEVSPRGNGLDCFRTWEALALGTIPIVKTSTLDPLYRDEQLPVVIVRDWDEITQDALARWHAELAPRFDAALERKLSHEHWAGKISAAAERAREGRCE
jgi:hypothetical protein